MENVGKLVEKSLKGDEDAFKEIFEMSYKTIYFKINKIVMDESSSMDILQNTYIKAHSNLSSLKEPKAFLKWLNVIATNETKDYLKKKKDINLSALDSEDGEIEFEIEDESLDYRPDAQADKEETRNIINSIIYKLPESQRAVIMMFYFEELQVSEIADILDLNVNTVKSRLRYAKQSIEKDVLDYEKDSGVKLYGFAPMAFFVWYLKEASQKQILPVVDGVLPNLASIAEKSSKLRLFTPIEKVIETFTSSTPLVKMVAVGLSSTILAGSAIAGISAMSNGTEPKLNNNLGSSLVDEDKKNEDQELEIEEDEGMDDIQDENLSDIAVNEKNPADNTKPDIKEETKKYQPTAQEKKAVDAANKIHDDRQQESYWIIRRADVINWVQEKGFTEKEAIYGADNSHFNWNAELVRSAQYFQALTPKSYTGLLKDLRLVHPEKDALYAANNISIDWKKQPFVYAEHIVKSHKSTNMEFSRLMLSNFLLNHGEFTQAEVNLVKEKHVVDWLTIAVDFADKTLKKTPVDELDAEMLSHQFTLEEITHAKNQLGI